MGAEELFKQITTDTEKVAAATEKAIWGDIKDEEQRKKLGIIPVLKQTAEQTEKIAARTKKTKKILRDLPTDIVAAQPPSVGEEILEGIGKIRTEFADVKKELTSKPIKENIGLIAKFREEFVEDTESTKREQLNAKI